MKNVSIIRTLKLKLALLFCLLLSAGWSQNAPLLECDDSAYYQTIRLQNPVPTIGDAGDFILFQINPITGAFNFVANLTVSDGPNDEAVPSSVNVNSLGINPIDRHFYFINARAPYQLYRMNAVGDVSFLGNVTGDISGNNQAGVFDNDGNYYVTGGSRKIFQIDVATRVSVELMDVNFVVSDLAINPDNGLLYGFDQNNRQLNTIDLNTNTTNTIGPPPNTSDYSIFGALYFLPSGQLIGYGDNTTIGPQGNSQESLVSFNLDTGDITPITTTYSVTTNDGASCPYTLAIDKMGPESISVGSTLTYTFSIFNRTGLLVNDVVFQDVLPNGLVFSSDPYGQTGGINITGTSDQLNEANLVINNVPVGISTFKLDLVVDCAYDLESVTNQALIGINNLDNPILSNDPSTSEVNDPTVTPINQLILEVPAEISLEGCEAEDITEANAVFDYSSEISGNVITTFDTNPDYNYSPEDISSIVYTDVVIDENACPLVVQRNFTATDLCGNTVSASQIIRVVDTVAPVPDAIPTDITVSCDEVGDTEPIDPFCSRTVVTQPYTGPGDTVRITFISKIIEENGDLVGYKFRIRNEQDAPITNVSVRKNQIVLFEVPVLAANTELFFNYGAAIAGVSVFWDGGSKGTASTNENDPRIVCDGLGLTENYTAIDNCDGLINGIASDERIDGDCPNEYTIVRTWSFTDSCGNIATAIQNINVIDEEAPVFGEIPAIITLDCAEEVNLSYTAIDNCDGEVPGIAEDVLIPGECDNDYIINRTWIFQDSCGNASRFDQTIVVKDEEAPTFVEDLPQDETVECEVLSDPAVLTAVDNCGEATVTFEEVVTDGDCDNNYTLERTWTATDACGNSTSHTQTINVIDTTGPEFVEELPQDETAECDLIPDAPVLTAQDDCGEATVSFEEAITDGDCANNYTIVRTWTATDSCGNATVHVQNVSVVDTTPPVFNEDIPADLIVECDSVPDPAEVTASDNCGDVTVVLEETTVPGECEEILTRTWTATDACNNTTELVQILTIVDTTPPNFVESLPMDTAVECSDIPEAETLTAIDNCSDAVVDFNEVIIGQDNEDETQDDECIYRAYYVRAQGSGSLFYRLVVENNIADLQLFASRNYSSHLAYDGENNIMYALVSTGQRVEKIDAISGGSLGFIELTPGLNSVASGTFHNGKLYLGSSNQDRIVEVDPATGTYTDYATNVPVSGADMEFKNEKLYLTTRSGNNMYLIENGGATLIGSIPDLVSGMCLTEDGNFYLSYNGSNSFAIVDENAQPVGSIPVFLDGQPYTLNNGDMASGCGDDSLPDLGECNTYSIVRTWTATDECGNATEHVQTITVEDTTAPTFVEELPGDITAECNNIPAPDVLTAVDDCSDAAVIFQETSTPGDCDGNFVITRTWTAVDSCGNSTSHTQNISVSDETPPEFISDLPQDITVECDEVPEPEDLIASDDCGGADVILEEITTPGSCDGEYLLERTWTASDACGNSVSHTQLVTVVDTTAPEIVGDFEDSIDVDCDDIPDAQDLVFEDNCSGVMDVVFDESSNQEDNANDYQITRSWTVTDNCGNEAEYVQTLNVSTVSVVDAFDSRTCNAEGPIDLFSYLNGDYDGSGTWILLEGDGDVTLEGSIFDPTNVEEETLFVFNYTEFGGSCAIDTNLNITVEVDCGDVGSCDADAVNIRKAVTANGDDINDTFIIEGIENCGFIIEVQIFNRWGAKVYESNDYDNDWGGEARGSSIGGSSLVPTGTYYYIVNLRNSGLDPFTGPIYVATNE